MVLEIQLMPIDKQMHAIAGILIPIGVNLLLFLFVKSFQPSIPGIKLYEYIKKINLYILIILAIGKEVVDLFGYGMFDLLDAITTLVFGVVILTALSVLFRDKIILYDKVYPQKIRRHL